jgi:hypothetical protein
VETNEITHTQSSFSCWSILQSQWNTAVSFQSFSQPCIVLKFVSYICHHLALCINTRLLLVKFLSYLTALGKWPTWRTILFYIFIFIFNSLHVSSTSCSSSGETKCVNTTSGSCHTVSVAVSCASRKWNFLPAHDTATDTECILMMSTMCSKHVES